LQCIATAIYVPSATTKLSILVRPERGSSWVVCVGDDHKPVSEHSNETEAERFALAYAAKVGCDAIEIKDAYHRLHPVQFRARGTAVSNN
jgi:hypothetical protein